MVKQEDKSYFYNLRNKGDFFMNEKILKYENGTKGITLIALVVTIIVLLILAGITIASIAGENGILNRASDAREQTEQATEDEQRQLASAEAAMNFESTKYVDPVTKEEVPIPAGFVVSPIAGENTVEDGLVIIDSEGNEFVWIPCGEYKEEENEYDATKYTNSKDDVIDNSWSHDEAYVSNGGTEGKQWRDNYTEEDATELKKKYTGDNALPTDKWKSENQITTAETSIKKYGGFYIARYEAGIPKNAENFYVSKSSSDLGYKDLNGNNMTRDRASNGEPGRGNFGYTSTIKNLKPVSKKGYQAWNYITQPNAKLVAENMYDDSNSVNSYLVDSQAWNTICNKFNDILGNTEEGKTVKDSRNIGNYWSNGTTKYENLKCLNALHSWSDSTWTAATTYKTVVRSTDTPQANKNNRLELSTGASDDFRVYNIYDMAGNIHEWTTGHYIKGETMYTVSRGRGLC